MSDDARPDWLPATDERLQYVGGPRTKAAIPAGLIGAAFVVMGVVGLIAPGPIPRAWPFTLGALGAIGLGIAMPVWTVLWLKHTGYVVTESALYTKRGILGRTVTSVGFETIQNVKTSQSVTGRLFDHGTIAVETAGSGGTTSMEGETTPVGPELAFKYVNDPRSIQRLIDTSATGSERSDDRIPGSTTQWQAVLDEVRAWRRAVEQSQ
ncbi:PH domain-containing protein [Halococcoides cellulosivorans]|uniref:YdbS-like PH domain-containing protein n=1 Tax=Halococcoides cellulosivorans TaxID=1679096 RepID=A0A2R4X1B0_9EURY|nr:PH domain-containing protein [Halococcoides cellulosivorans]AWB27570.1 hypothetical protein HARCEL1_07530 [Halococcoides cellulosivorans]